MRKCACIADTIARRFMVQLQYGPIRISLQGLATQLGCTSLKPLQALTTRTVCEAEPNICLQAMPEAHELITKGVELCPTGCRRAA